MLVLPDEAEIADIAPAQNELTRYESAFRSRKCLILLLDTQIALLLTLLASKRASP
jgi:hypothetical protein